MKHTWTSSEHHLGLVGSFWKYVYPLVCKTCGALAGSAKDDSECRERPSPPDDTIQEGG
ncbi:hypothetical protein LCGC14_1252280 [marine sediment metagenome]|uniref:Uncharacterized protein n=1 Tax=marine sediment metagenome TaxID=412755 RepID=A0A0F9NJT6_9ZZZZ